VFPWQTLIRRFKSPEGAPLASWLASLMVDSLNATHPSFRAHVDVVIPMATWAERLQERGHHPAWELAQRVAKAKRLQARHDVLLRPGAATSQRHLSRADRLRNMQGAFVVPPGKAAQVQGRRVALVDDVVTTGATVNEASRVLRQAGATEVHVWALAQTPE
jgi:ComF family protein